MAEQQPIYYTLTLRAPGGADGERRLKAVLKIALRSFDLKCVRCVRQGGSGAQGRAPDPPGLEMPAGP